MLCSYGGLEELFKDKQMSPNSSKWDTERYRLYQMGNLSYKAFALILIGLGKKDTSLNPIFDYSIQGIGSFKVQIIYRKTLVQFLDDPKTGQSMMKFQHPPISPLRTYGIIGCN